MADKKCTHCGHVIQLHLEHGGCLGGGCSCDEFVPSKPYGWELDLLNKIADKLNLPAGADLEGILPLLDEKLK